MVAPGSYFVIDDVELTGTAGIINPKNTLNFINKFNPNSVNNSANIYFSLPVNEIVTIELFDITGKKC